jgi:replicative DNA helicase
MTTSPEAMPPVNMLMSALWWAGKGIPVLPLHYPLDGACSCGQGDACQSPAKHPIHRLVPHGLTDATTDADIVRDWWVQKPYANIGIRTGDVVDLLDIDSADGLTAFGKLVEQAGGMPQHLGIAQSGRDGYGQHIYVIPGGERALSGGKTAPAGIDVKGRGGYAVAPPSLHITGRRYTWQVNNFDTAEPAGAVDWPTFYQRLAIRPPEPARTPRPTTLIPADAADAYGRAVLARALGLVAHSTSGNRWQTLAIEAIPLVSRAVDGGCVDRDSAVRELEDASRQVGLSTGEIARIGPLVDDMIARGIRHPIRPKEAAQQVAPVPDYATEDEARTDPWEPPWPLRYPTPPFPVEVMGWMGEHITRLSDQLQTPVDLVGMMTLAAMAATVRGRIRAHVIGTWDEPLNLYIAAVLGPGETKSPALSQVVSSLRAMETEARATTKDVITARQFDKELLEERARKLRENAVKAKGGPSEVLLAQTEARDAAADADAMTVPTMPLWLAGDMTPEALVSKLAEQGGSLAHLSAEGELLDTIVGGRYSSGAPHISALLTAHDGREPMRVHRKNAPDIEVNDPCLTLGLAVQPQVLEQMGKVDAAVRRGLAARFLFAMPASLVGRRDMTLRHRHDGPDGFAILLRGVDALCRAGGGFGDIGSESGPGQDPNVSAGHRVAGISGTSDVSAGQRVLGITGPSAYRAEVTTSSLSLFLRYREELEPRRAETGDLGEVGPWANKLDGQIVRLAALLQVLHTVGDTLSSGTSTHNPQNPEPIGVEAMSGALVLADYLIAHAVEAHAVMRGAGAGDDYERARQLLGWIGSNSLKEFTAHEAERSLRKRVTFREQGAVHEACGTLARLGWIRYMPADPKPGRPTARYLVHPDVHA